MNRRRKRSGLTCTINFPWAFNNGVSCCKYDIDYHGNPISLTSPISLYGCQSYTEYSDCRTYGCTNYQGKQISYQANDIYIYIYILY